MDTDGFTIDTNGTTTVDVKVASLCMQNLNAFAGTFARANASAGPESQNVNGIEFTPSALLAITTQLATDSTAINTQSRLAIGASDGTRHAVSSAIAEANNSTPEAHSMQRNDKMAVIANGVTGNVDGYATVSAWLSSPTGGFTAAWNPNLMGGTANIYTYLAMSTPSAAAVDLERFEAVTTGKRLHFRWRTGLEASNLGFHIQEERAGVRQRLTPEPIAGSGFLLGSQHNLNSGEIAPVEHPGRPQRRRARYWLEEIDLAGQEHAARAIHRPPGAARIRPGGAHQFPAAVRSGPGAVAGPSGPGDEPDLQLLAASAAASDYG